MLSLVSLQVRCSHGHQAWNVDCSFLEMYKVSAPGILLSFSAVNN